MGRKLNTCDHCDHVQRLMWQMSIAQWFAILIFTGVVGLVINKVGDLMVIRLKASEVQLEHERQRP